MTQTGKEVRQQHIGAKHNGDKTVTVADAILKEWEKRMNGETFPSQEAHPTLEKRFQRINNGRLTMTDLKLQFYAIVFYSQFRAELITCIKFSTRVGPPLPPHTFTVTIINGSAVFSTFDWIKKNDPVTESSAYRKNLNSFGSSPLAIVIILAAAKDCST